MRPTIISFVIFVLTIGALMVSHMVRSATSMFDGVDFAILIGMAIGFLVGTINGRWFAHDRKHSVQDFFIL